jgi:lipopolysaccharide export system permease protein
MVAVAMDVSERMDKFISNDLSFRQVAMDYYRHFIPWINGELWPLFAFLSVIFFTSRLARDSEVIAMLSAGIPYARILRPMMIAAFVVSILHWAGENYVIPPSTNHLNEFKNEYINKSIIRVLSNDIQFFISPNQKIYTRNFYIRDSSLTKFRLETFDNYGQLISLMKADRLKYNLETDRWSAKDYEMRTFDGLHEGLIMGKEQEIDTALNMHPSDFVKHSQQMEIMSTPDLNEYVIREKAKGLDNTKKYEIEVYKRTAGPFTILILTLIGATIGTKKVRGGLGMHLAIGVVLGATYVVLSKFSETFASNLSLPSLIGVWLPNILFAAISIVLYFRAQK